MRRDRFEYWLHALFLLHPLQVWQRSHFPSLTIDYYYHHRNWIFSIINRRCHRIYICIQILAYHNQFIRKKEICTIYERRFCLLRETVCACFHCKSRILGFWCLKLDSAIIIKNKLFIGGCCFWDLAQGCSFPTYTERGYTMYTL